jgi:hypothetical protein
MFLGDLFRTYFPWTNPQQFIYMCVNFQLLNPSPQRVKITPITSEVSIDQYDRGCLTIRIISEKDFAHMSKSKKF